MSEQAIVLNELTKHYGKHRGINNLSFSVNQGEFFGFIGPNEMCIRDRLNIDGKGRSSPETVVAKSARPSVLEGLRRPVPPRTADKKTKTHEEVR